MTGKSESTLFEYYRRYIDPVYSVHLARIGLLSPALKAEGASITDSQGNDYLDCVGGYGILNLGHNHPRITAALIKRLKDRPQLNRPLISADLVELAEKLAEITPGRLSRTFLCNSGSEAVDSAIKLARLVQKKPGIITATGGFHGFTCGALSAAGIPALKKPFGPLVPEIRHVPYGDATALADTIDRNTAAVLLEPAQHETGVNLPPAGYFQEVRQICDRRNVILIIDEVKTGFGRTGRMFACEHYDLAPDIMVLGKSMGGGLIPAGALIGKDEFWKTFCSSFPMAASSYAGNVLACTAALETIDILETGSLIEEAGEKGEMILSGLDTLVNMYPELLNEAAGQGLLISLTTAGRREAFELSREMISQGVLMLQAGGDRSVLMIEPPLVISETQVKRLLLALNKACENAGREIRGR